MYYNLIRALHDLKIIHLLVIFIPTTTASDQTPLQDVSGFNISEPCVQDCAISASNAYSSSFSCPSSGPASCICNAGGTMALVAATAHSCAITSCPASASSDPERARTLLTGYCESNGIEHTSNNVPVNALTIC